MNRLKAYILSSISFNRASSDFYPKNATGVKIVAKEWTDAFSAEVTEKIASLYDEDASLWGTLSAERRDSNETIKNYFDSAFIYSDRSVKIKNTFIKMYGSIAINVGEYTFSWVSDGTKVTIPARYSFTYIYKNNKWMIIEHHSSRMP